MERLTTRNIAGVAVYKNPFKCEQCGDTIWWLPDYCNGSPTEKLTDYEDAEEKGLLLRLPCKVGDTVYTLHKNIVKEEKVYDVQYRGINYQQGQRWFMNIGATVYFEMDFGKTVFLTQAEAEQKLKEMEV